MPLSLAFLRDLFLFISVVKTAFLPWLVWQPNIRAWMPACTARTGLEDGPALPGKRHSRLLVYPSIENMIANAIPLNAITQ